MENFFNLSSRMVYISNSRATVAINYDTQYVHCRFLGTISVLTVKSICVLDSDVIPCI